jgi:hypothetical protein
MDNYLQQGIMAAKAGDKPRAFDLLTRASEIPETSEQAWLWLSSVVKDDSERLFCLDHVLRINPNHVNAQRGAAMFRQKGICPAVPIYPEAPRAAVEQDFTPKQVPPSKISQVNFPSSARTQAAPVPVIPAIPTPRPSYEADWEKKELSALYQYAVMELASNKSLKEVEKLLMGRGALPNVAKTVAMDAQYVVRKSRCEKYKKRMTRGFLWTVAGVVITCITYYFASELGGRFYLFYGAIGFGLIDFIAGFFGWLFNG